MNLDLGVLNFDEIDFIKNQGFLNSFCRKKNSKTTEKNTALQP